MTTCVRVATGLLFIGLLAGCATMRPRPQEASREDDGYFLSWQQKGQLIGQGRIQDGKENWYDIWIVPGYAQPVSRAGKYMDKAGDAFAEYGGARKYHELARHSRKAFEFAYDDCLCDFIGHDLPRAWDRYWEQAERRSQKRVFGWWFSYPWATLETVVDPVVRVPLGVCGSVLGTVWGGVAVPSYYMLDSTAVGSWQFAANGLVVPTLACTWNTVIAPPMSMVGQKPAPSRVDGFWVTMISPDEYARQERMAKPVPDEEVQALVLWGKMLLQESRSMDEKRRQIEADRDQAMHTAHEVYMTNYHALAKAEKVRLREAGHTPANEKVLLDLQAHGVDTGVIRNASKRLQELLSTEKGLSAADRCRLEALLYMYPPATFDQTTDVPVPVRPKSDPVENSIRMLQDANSGR